MKFNNRKLSCRREAAPCFVLLKFLLSRSRTSLKMVSLLSESFDTVSYSHSVATVEVSLAVLTQYTNVMDTQPSTAARQQMPHLCIASRGKNRYFRPIRQLSVAGICKWKNQFMHPPVKNIMARQDSLSNRQCRMFDAGNPNNQACFTLLEQSPERAVGFIHLKRVFQDRHIQDRQ